MPQKTNTLESILDRLRLTPEGCWEWTGHTVHNRGPAYGQVRVCGKQCVVHKYVYENLVELVPEGLELDHLCRNGLCANPDHLEPVTHSENMQRAALIHSGWGQWKRRLRVSCRKGHVFTEDNLYHRSDEKRECRQCRADRGRKRKAR